VALRRYREGFVRDAQRMPSLDAQVGEIVAAIDRLHLIVNHELGHDHEDDDGHEDAPIDYSEIHAAVARLPPCLETNQEG
jgi:hypothetical protein